MPRYLLDTNVFIHIRQRHPLSVVARFEQAGPREVALSVVSYGELNLWRGEKQQARVEPQRDRKTFGIDAHFAAAEGGR
jgi:predicted nucleic acid-binding protein